MSGVSNTSSQTVAAHLRDAFEALFFENGVDMTWSGHLHLYQRTQPVFNGTVLGYDANGTARAPMHVVLGNAGARCAAAWHPPAGQRTQATYPRIDQCPPPPTPTPTPPPGPRPPSSGWLRRLLALPHI